MNGWINYLQTELQRRQAANPLYGLRALAKQLAISPAQLSQMLSGKRPVSRKMAAHLAKVLAIPPGEQRMLEDTTPANQKPTLDEEHFGLIAHWAHFAILSLAEIKENKADPRWIARRLGLGHAEVREALERLQRLGLLEIQQGKLKATMAAWQTTPEVASVSVRRSHKTHLELAARKLDEVPVEWREFTTLTMAVNPQKIKQAKVLVKKFKHEMESILESGKKSEVFTLAIQLYPLSDVQQEKT